MGNFSEAYNLIAGAMGNQQQTMLGMMSLGLRQEQLGLTASGQDIQRQRLEQDQEELELGKAQELNTITGQLLGAAEKLPEATRGQAMNSVIQMYSQATGRQIDPFQVADPAATFAGVTALLKAGDPQGASDLVDQMNIVSSPEQIKANDPTFRAKIARETISGRNQVPPATDETGAKSYEHSYKLFRQGHVMSDDGRKPEHFQGGMGENKPMVLPNDMYDDLVRHDAEVKANERFVENFGLLPHEKQVKLFDAMTKKEMNQFLRSTNQEMLPITDEEEMSQLMYSQWQQTEEQIAQGSTDPEVDRKNMEAKGYLKITTLPKADDELNQATIRKLNKDVEVSETRRQNYESTMEHRTVQTEMAKHQIELVDAKARVQAEVALAIPAGVARKQADLEFRKMASASKQQFDMAKFGEFAAKNQAEIDLLEQKVKAYTTNNETLSEKNRLDLEDTKSQITYRKAMQDHQEAMLEFEQDKSALNWKKLGLAEQEFLKQSELIDARVGKIQREGKKAGDDLNSLQEARRLKVDVERETKQRTLDTDRFLDQATSDLPPNATREEMQAWKERTGAPVGLDEIATRLRGDPTKADGGFSAPITLSSGKPGTARIKPDAGSPTGFSVVEVPTPGKPGQTTPLVSEKTPLFKFGSGDEKQVQAKSVIQATDELIGKFDKVGKHIVGPIDQVMTNIKRVAGMVPADRLEYESDLNSLAGEYRHALYGSALTAQEIKSALGFIPNMNDQDNDHMAKLKSMRKITKRVHDNREEAMGKRIESLATVSDDDRMKELTDMGASYQEALRIMVEEGR